ncbi:hypothetical protein N8150_02465 [Gammaproteobacteria bacterium]|nr:hypothetical protein [Gammaproteobacteria bacterium]
MRFIRRGKISLSSRLYCTFEKYSTFYGDLDILDFEASFQQHFKKPYHESIIDFNKFIKSQLKN